MQWLDWVLIAFPLILVVGVGVFTQRYLKSVSDFLSGGRLAGRYLLAVSKGEIGAGAVSFAAAFEVFNKSGFSVGWWGNLAVPVTLFLTITGFVFYRYRETKAMTLAQFFEIRYSRSFRIFTGFLGFGAGIVNFGIIPAVGARFIAHFMGFPPFVHAFSRDIPIYIPVMAVLLGLTVFVTLTGGFITLMITDCLEGVISQIFYLLLIFGLLSMFHWSQISHVLADRPPGMSLMNAFDSMKLKDFNLWYVLMSMLVSIYGTMAWQNQSAYNSAAISAHEARMSGILSHWRIKGKSAVMVLLCACAMTYLQHPDFSVQSKAAHAEIEEIAKPQIREQMQIPIALKHMLPMGLKGAFCVILLMGIFGGDGTHLHSWGGMFIQDIVVPLRKTPMDPKQHIKWLRCSMAGVAFFAFLFGSLFQQTDYIQMWWQVTMGLYVGGAGAAIIGGLYWKKGTTAGAWTGMLTGSILSTAGIVAKNINPHFPLNGMQISFFSAIIAFSLYVFVSLLTCRKDFNMDRMLHRGEYAIGGNEAKAPHAAISIWKKIVGLDENFSRGDRWIAYSLFWWTMFWFAVFVICTLWNFIVPWPKSWWSEYYKLTAITIATAIAVLITVWFTWGVLKDMREFFRRLRLEKVNILDNGMVVGHQNLSEVAKPPVAVSAADVVSSILPAVKEEIKAKLQGASET